MEEYDWNPYTVFTSAMVCSGFRHLKPHPLVVEIVPDYAMQQAHYCGEHTYYRPFALSTGQGLMQQIMWSSAVWGLAVSKKKKKCAELFK